MNTEATSYFFIILILGFFLVTLFVSVAKWSIEFSGELRAINIEIKRSSGREREYYKKKRRRLILSILPFVKY